MNSTPKQYQPFMMAEERAARSVFGKSKAKMCNGRRHVSLCPCPTCANEK